VRDGRAGAAELATLLVNKGAAVNAVVTDIAGNASTPLWWAARAVRDGEAGGPELALLLVERGADVNAVGQGLTLVHFSAQPEPFPTQYTAYTPPSTP